MGDTLTHGTRKAVLEVCDGELLESIITEDTILRICRFMLNHRISIFYEDTEILIGRKVRKWQVFTAGAGLVVAVARLQ